MKSDAHKCVKKILKKEFKGYVLVTCKPPSKDGHMQVEMSYDGDPVLAAYMMEGAQEYLAEEDDKEPFLELMK